MQLLDSDQLEYAFAAHGISRESHARRFYAELWDFIQEAERIRDPLALSKIENKVRRLCKEYFSVMRIWREEETERNEGEQSCAASKDNEMESCSMLPVFEKNFTRYALCYLELNRALIQTRAQLAHLARDYDINEMSKHLKINHATGSLLQRAHRERKSIMEKRLRLERVEILLRQSDPLIEFLGGELPRLYGQERGDQQLTLLKGALRRGNFYSARRVVSIWGHDWLKKSGNSFVDMVEKNREELKAQDGLMLHSGELALIKMFLKSDETRINQFMTKYNIPYMVFKYRNLLHQGYLLGRIGSIEALIIQHAKLLTVAARPQSDADAAKIHEQAVLVPARATQRRFRNLSPILDELETTTAILEKLFAQTREYMAHTPENLQN